MQVQRHQWHFDTLALSRVFCQHKDLQRADLALRGADLDLDPALASKFIRSVDKQMSDALHG